MSRRRRVSFITTWRTNIGDDFVREGIRAVLDTLFHYQGYIINKHEPERTCTLPVEGDEGPPLRDKILDADLVFQCGAPVYWNLGEAPGHKCATAEWVKPLWHDRVAATFDRIPVLNLAAGACQGYYGNAGEIVADRDCEEFARRIHRYSRLTTVRDTMAEAVNTMLGLSVVRQPCASIHAWRRQPVHDVEPRCIALNFMPLAGHYDLEGRIVPDEWARNFVAIDQRLREASQEVLLIAHDEAEMRAMQSLLPGREVFFSRDYRDYFPIYAKCRGGVFNRVHGAMLLAGMGAPAIVIGNDSRSRMVDELGLPRLHVSEVDAARVSGMVLDQVASTALSRRLREIQLKAFEELRDLCRTILTPILSN